MDFEMRDLLSRVVFPADSRTFPFLVETMAITKIVALGILPWENFFLG